MKYATSWIASQEKKLGPWLEEFPAWKKVRVALTSDPVMRGELLRCMSGKIPPEKAEGIAECHVVIKKALASKDEAARSKVREKEEKEQEAREEAKRAVKEQAALEAVPSTITDLLGGCSAGPVPPTGASDEHEDPVVKSARAEALLKAGSITWHRDAESLGASLQELVTRLGTQHPLHFLVDAGAAPSTLSSYLAVVAKTLLPNACETWRATVIGGPRAAQFASLGESMRESFPLAGIFHSMVTSDPGRSSSNRTMYMVGPQDWVLTAVFPAPLPVDLNRNCLLYTSPSPRD